MGIVVSLVSVAVGALLLWAVGDGGTADIDVAGIALMIVGLVGLGVSIACWPSPGGGTDAATAGEDET